MSVLSSKQRTTLARIGRECYDVLNKAGAIDEPFDAWRKRVAIAACGRSISQANNDDWDPILIAFYTSAGRADKALDLAMSRVTNSQRTLWHRITQALASADLPDSYALPIAVDAHYVTEEASLTDLQTLPPRQLRALSYTVTARCGAHLRKRKAQSQPS